jgi:hypothetical protein
MEKYEAMKHPHMVLLLHISDYITICTKKKKGLFPLMLYWDMAKLHPDGLS